MLGDVWEERWKEKTEAALAASWTALGQSSSDSESDNAGPSCREKGSTSKQQRTLFLASIGNLSDRALQQMLFKRRFFFRLKPPN
jgi:hypothetical protein